MKPRGSVTGPARWRLAATACGVALLTVACGSSSSSTASGGSTPTAAAPSASAASSALCADAAALRSSLGKLTSLQASPGAGVVSEARADLAGVKVAAANFASHAKGQWQSQTSALKAALTSLETAVQNLTANPSASAISGAITAVGQVSTAAQQLFAAVGKACPGT